MNSMNQVGGGANQARVRATDHMHRNGRQVIPESPLVVEAGMERGAGEIVTQLWNDTSAQEDATACAECQREVGRGGAQNGAEDIERAQAVRARFTERPFADLRWRQRLQFEPCSPRQAAVNELQAGAGKKTLHGDVPVNFASFVPEPRLGFVAGRKAGVPTFAGQRDPFAVVVGDQPRYAQPRTGPQDADGRAAYSLPAANQFEFLRRQVWNRKRQGGKIVQQNELVETQAAPSGFNGERPVCVGHADLVAGNRVGHADDGRFDCGHAFLRKILAQRRFEIAVIGGAPDPYSANVVRGATQRKADVGATDIANESQGAVEGANGHRAKLRVLRPGS